MGAFYNNQPIDYSLVTYSEAPEDIAIFGR
jgi:hypothetical protein